MPVHVVQADLPPVVQAARELCRAFAAYKGDGRSLSENERLALWNLRYQLSQLTGVEAA